MHSNPSCEYSCYPPHCAPPASSSPPSCAGDDSKCSSIADDCCACDASIGQTTCGWEEPATCRDGYVAVPTPGADGGTSCDYSCYPPGCDSSLVGSATYYTAVSGRGCSSYVHMDDPDTHGVKGGSTTLAQCAAAVLAYNGQDGCVANYFFFERWGYCNCPRDATCSGMPNSKAGSPGQLYRFTGVPSPPSPSPPPPSPSTPPPPSPSPPPPSPSPPPPSPSTPPPLPPGASEQVVSRPKVTVVLKVDMTLDAYTGDQERIKGALRAKLGCDEPLCVLQVTVTPGSVILTVVAMDTSPSSQLVVAATTMVSNDVTTLSTDLGISVVEHPTLQTVWVEVTVLRPAPSPPQPPSPGPKDPSPPGSGEESSLVLIMVGAGALLALLVLLVAAFLFFRKAKRDRQNRARTVPNGGNAERCSTFVEMNGVQHPAVIVAASPVEMGSVNPLMKYPL